MKKDLIPMLPDGESVLYHHAATSEDEAKWIVSQMLELNDGSVPFRDMTVLYRAHYITRTIEDVLRKAKIPYTIYSGVQFYDRIEIKNALSYLRMIAYKDDLSFRRIVNVPKRNLGERRIKFLEEFAAEHNCSLYDALMFTVEDDIFKRTKAPQFIKLIESFSANYADRTISELLADILDKSGYEEALRTEGSQERLDNIAELKQSVYDYERTCGEESMLEHYLAHIALYTNTDTEVKGDKVKLMTVHAAKGLEFPYVFLCAMSEGIFPSKKTNTMEKMEEERRLAFVAMTRAEKRLYLSEAEGRNLDGSPRFPSRFVLDIDDSLLEHTNKPDDCLIRDAKDYIEWTVKYMPENLDNIILPAGQRVRHAVFGEGTVMDVDNNKGAHIIKFDAMDTPRTISFKVKIEKL